MTLKCLLYRPSWQELRVTFLAEHRDDGGWTTIEGTHRNLEALHDYTQGNEDYLDSWHQNIVMESRQMGYSSEGECAARLYRSINCLNAVRMGNSGQGQKGSTHDLLVLEFRNELQRIQKVSYQQNLSVAAARWDWRIVDLELRGLLKLRPQGFERIEKSLVARVGFSDKKTGSENTIVNRKELVTFVEIMRKVRTGE